MLVVEVVLLEHLGHRVRFKHLEPGVFWVDQHVVDLDHAFVDILRPCGFELLLKLKLEEGHSIYRESKLLSVSVVA